MNSAEATQQAADADGRRLRRTVQAREEIRHAQQAERADEREHRADEDQRRHDRFKPGNRRHETSYSMTSPRVMYFDSTTVVTKPSIAISSAAS